MLFTLVYLLAVIASFFSGTINIVSLGIGIIGIILSVFLFFKSRRIKEPRFSSRSTRLIGKEVSNIDDLRIYYGDKQLSSLTITKLAFWNTGRDTISNSDISKVDQLRIECKEDVEILSCEILTQSKEANAFSTAVHEDGKSISLDFDYIDYREGAVLRIRHTGSSFNDLALKGSIKAVHSIEKQTVSPPIYDIITDIKPSLGSFSIWIHALLGVTCLFLGVLVVFHPEILYRVFTIGNSNSSVYRILGYVLCSVFVISGFSYFYLIYMKVRPLLPSKLNDVFWNEDF